MLWGSLRNTVILMNFYPKAKVSFTEKRESTKQKEAEGSGGSAAIKRDVVHIDGTMSFTIEDLLRASAEVMGQSVYGTYYKATLENGDRVVVNRLGGKFTKTPTDVEAVLNLLGQIRHPDLFAMRAYYFHPEGDKLLVYDYTPEGSLATFLHAERPEPPGWLARTGIAKGVARGLLSLHTHHNIIHGNLTSSNIFLDENINPKISDFGLSQLITVVAPNSKMSATAGVLGYKAPELYNLEKEKADKKSDVYSLGVIMLELLTGKSPGEVEDLDLSRWVKMTGTTAVFDPELLRYTSVKKEMLKVLQLAIDCVSKLPEDRPDVHIVLQQLEEFTSETASTSSDDGGAGPSLS